MSFYMSALPLELVYYFDIVLRTQICAFLSPSTEVCSHIKRQSYVDGPVHTFVIGIRENNVIPFTL